MATSNPNASQAMTVKTFLALIALVLWPCRVQAEYCGGQDWHSGWLTETQVTYQASAHLENFSVFGGKTDAASRLSPVSTSAALYDPS